MEDFDKLLKLDPVDISQKTFISIDEIKAILDKRFEVFVKTKAIGFIKILEREYELDLSQWLEEYEEYLSENKSKNEEIFVVAKDQESSILDNKKTLYLISGFIIVAILIGLYFFTTLKNKDEKIVNAYSQDKVQEVVKTIEENDSNTDKTIEENIQDSVLEIDENVSSQEQAVPKDIFYIEPKTKLWVGIEYLDSGKKSNKIIVDRLDLNASKNQKITLGHGYFKLVFNDKTVEPKTANIYKITFIDKELEVKKVPIKKKPKEKTQQDNQKMSEEDTNGIQAPNTKPADEIDTNGQSQAPIQEQLQIPPSQPNQ